MLGEDLTGSCQHELPVPLSVRAQAWLARAFWGLRA